jgi:hypothetical protein
MRLRDRLALIKTTVREPAGPLGVGSCMKGRLNFRIERLRWSTLRLDLKFDAVRKEAKKTARQIAAYCDAGWLTDLSVAARPRLRAEV